MEGWIGRAQKNFRAEKLICMILQCWIRITIHLSKPLECTPRVKPNVNYEFWVIMMSHCRFIYCNKFTPLVGDADNGGGCACVGTGGVRETSVPSSQFCYKPKTALKNKVLKKSFLPSSQRWYYPMFPTHCPMCDWYLVTKVSTVILNLKFSIIYLL